MINPIHTLKSFKSRLGKPVRPLIELQKDGSIVNVLTSTVQTENLINDAYHSEAWEVPPEARASAIYIDGVFKGMGFFAGEEGCILQVSKDVELYGPVLDKDGKPIEKTVKIIDEEGNPVLDADGKETFEHKPLLQRITFAAKGIIGRLLDASLYERGSALKPSLTTTLIYCALVGAFCFMAGMNYGK